MMLKQLILFKTFIDEGFGTFGGNKNQVEYWINNVPPTKIKTIKMFYDYVNIET